MLDMSQVKDQIGDQLRAFLINMLPQEALDQAIETSWRKLTEPRKELDYNGRPKRDGKTIPSELEQMVTEAMREQLKKRVAEWAEEWRKTPDCDAAAKPMLSELIDRAASGFVHRIAGGIVREAAEALAGNANPVAYCNCGRLAIKGQQCPNCDTWN